VTQTKRPGLSITEEPGGMIRKLLIDYDGETLLDQTILPHDDLIRFMDRPFKDYYKRLLKLEAHPLFKESLDISEADFVDFMDSAFDLVYTLREDFPEAWFFSRVAMEDALTVEDDNSASILLVAGMNMLNAARIPYLTRVRMRNMMEVCFGTTDGMTQQQRYERTTTVYPILGKHRFSVLWDAEQDWARTYEIRSLLELYFFELCAALRSEKNICRCKNCWRYFVPKTKKKTDYCDRRWKDGSTCKQRGPNLKRKDGPTEDIYLLAFKKLRARFYERDYRMYTVQKGLEVPGGDYSDWMEEAGAARMEYLEGTISGEEFLRRINPEGEELDLEQDATTPAEDILFVPWEKLVEGNLSFDPNRHFQRMQIIDLGVEDPQWKIVTAGEQARAAKRGNISLMEKYRRK